VIAILSLSLIFLLVKIKVDLTLWKWVPLWSYDHGRIPHWWDIHWFHPIREWVLERVLERKCLQHSSRVKELVVKELICRFELKESNKTKNQNSLA